ncbi:AMP-dependent synthetase and ligase [metagenome]|uniref:AMP-dependent synthetase and ligase n=1 Tax=metagenome TaxID=256318 RepID=A0A2P2BXY6_9ZZZZ
MLPGRRAVESLSTGLASARVLASSGVVRPISPVTLTRVAWTLRTWGLGPAGGFRAVALRYPDRAALVDEIGTLTYDQLHRRSNALARALRQRGVREGDAVAILCRNHRGFVEATLAVAKLGADALYLNTSFAAPQLSSVLEREKAALLVHDEEFAGLVDFPVRVLAWSDSPSPEPTLDSLIASASEADLRPPGRRSRTVILTSGTTGAPKGAARSEAGIGAAVSMLSRLPLRDGWTTHIAAPLFHTWGFAHLAFAMLLGSTVVLTRGFDPETCLEVTQDFGCESLVVIPVMLQRILRLPEATLAAYDLSAVRVVASSGSALPGDLAWSWMDRFGDRLYNVYGSTEVAYASIATPEDLRAAPTSAGRPPLGTVVRILDASGRTLPAGGSGRIFVGNSLLFEGYTGGGGKQVVQGLMSTGDVGRFDTDGRLYVEGRDDEMIVSGGENVFPQVVEDCLVRHPQVVEAAAIGVPDPDFGQRLRAFVVTAGPVGEAELRRWVKEHLSGYQAPRDFVFVDELPRNATGKVVKRDLG